MNVTAVKRLIPTAVKPPLRRIRSRLQDRADRPALHRLHEHLRAEWGDDLLLEVAPVDEMALFGYGNTMSVAAQIQYFTTGPTNMRELQCVFDAEGIDLATAGQILDFAGGYGRLTRYIVQRAGPEHVSHSDISAEAVYWVTKRLHIRGFTSTSLPEDLHHDGHYDLILAVSLFSHLPIETWGRWLVSLTNLLSTGGRLLFSTANYDRVAELPPEMAANLRIQADGFGFVPQNETLGRLPEDQYGSAYVTRAWVDQAVDKLGLEGITSYYPATLWGSQDAYILQRPT